MQSLDARAQSFAKAKRVKSSSGKYAVLKWPHPSTFAATPATLSEAGFYYDPSSSRRDGVKCFMCNKGLDSWEEEDDPFAIHLEKARGTCPWALVRYYAGDEGDESPSGKTLEKARIGTFEFGWPHDSVRSHGANSKKMAKAGFAFTPQSPDDDTATCFYCGIALSGWDADDNPLEEHRKREVKSGVPCRFLESISMSQVRAASTSTRPSKSTTRPPSRTNSRRKAPEPESDDDDGDYASLPEEASDDELLTNGGTAHSRRGAAPSRASTLTSLPSKASRRTTRTAGSRHARDVSAVEEAEEDPDDNEAGKKVSRSKGKTRRATAATKGRTKDKEKAKEEAVVEEDEAGDAHSQASAEAEEPPVKPKRGRGRPAGSGKAKKEPAASKQKKTPVTVASTVGESAAEKDGEMSTEAPVEPKLTRSRSKANIESESEAEPGRKSTTKSKSRTKPSSKSTGKAKAHHEMQEVEVLVPPPPPTKSHGKATGVHDTEYEEPRTEPSRVADDAGAKVKVPLSKTKQRLPLQVVSDDDDELDVVSSQEVPANGKPTIAPASKSDKSEPRRHPPERGTKRKSSTTSDDAGYSTAHHMDVDDEPPTRKSRVTPPAAPAPDRSIASQDAAGTRSTQSRMSSQPQRHPIPKTRTSSRPMSRVPSRNGMLKDEVVDISSSDDEDELLLAPPKSNGKVANVASPPLAKATAAPAKPASKVATPTIDLTAVNHTAAKVKSQKQTPPQPRPVANVVPKTVPPPPPEAPSPLPAPPIARDVTEVTSDVEVPDVNIAVPVPVEDAPEEHGELSNATPPPHTPSASPRTSEPPAQQAMPSFDDAVASTSTSPYTPYLSLVPVQRLTSLTEEESNMTIEEYIEQEIKLQYEQFKQDGERKIAQFMAQAAETRKIIEAA